MTKAELAENRELEGRVVGIALRGGRRLDDCQLIALPRRGTNTFWVFSGGEDVFLPAEQVLAVWESPTVTRVA